MSRRPRPPRVGVFGGTFDPPHVGHTAMAAWARESLSLDRVVFVPSGRPPHKRHATHSAARHRLAMTRLAARDLPGFEVSSVEVRRPGPSYTSDTLLDMARREPHAERFLIIGADMFDVFRTWHAWELILALATVVVAMRPGARAPRTPRWAHKGRGVVWLDNPGLDVSSTRVRRRLAAGHAASGIVAPAVARYAARHGLYRRRDR